MENQRSNSVPDDPATMASQVQPASDEEMSRSDIIMMDDLIDQEKYRDGIKLTPLPAAGVSSSGDAARDALRVKATDLQAMTRNYGEEGGDVDHDALAAAEPDLMFFGNEVLFANTFAGMKKRWETPEKDGDPGPGCPFGFNSLPHQEMIYHFYQTRFIQFFVAGCIVMNFATSAVSRQLGADMYTDVFETFEWFFLVVFTIELVINMYGAWWSLFWHSSWNVFDFVVVIISLLSVAFPDLPGISVLRLFRAFRVVRLFKRIETLRIIIAGILASLPGVFNAFAVTSILMSIWAIMGVDFFSAYMDDHFGTYIKAMFTMWKMMTLEGWADISDGLIYDNELPLAAIYFISYTFLVGMVMTNVVVAILLERYLASTDTEKELISAKKESDKKEEQDAADKAAGKKVEKPDKQIWNTVVEEAVACITSGQYERALHLARCLAIREKTKQDVEEDKFHKYAKQERLLVKQKPAGECAAWSGNEFEGYGKVATRQSRLNITGKQFADTAPHFSAEILGCPMIALPQTFPVSGTRGWNAGSKVEFMGTDGKPRNAVVQINVTVLGGEAWTE